VADKARQDFAIEGVDEPDHKIFTSRDQHRGLVMPLNEIQVLLGDIIEGLLERKAVFNIPNAQQVVHSASDKPFAA